MIGRRNAHLFWTRITFDCLPLLAFFVAYLVRFAGCIEFSSTDYEPKFYFGLLILTTVVWSVVADHYGLAVVDVFNENRTAIDRILLAYATTYMLLFTFLFFYRVQTFSRVFLAISAIVLLTGAVAARLLLVRLVCRKQANGNPLRLLVVGADDFAVQTASVLESLTIPTCRIMGFVQLEGTPSSSIAAPVFRIEELRDFALGNPIDEIIIAVSPARSPETRMLLPALERLGVPVRAAFDFGIGANIRDRLWQFGGLCLASVSSTPLDTIYYLLFKRALDFVVAVIAIIVTAPLLLGIAVVIRFSSRGPVLFIQDRVGLNGRLFRMYKFRTMRLSPTGEGDTRWTRRNDDRCTPIGRVLRRTSLDELPQFLNVLKGEMSVVGPRPERPYFVRQFLQETASYNNRHRLKVGITGWAQVNGLRGDTSIRDRLQYDLYYLQNWSLLLDLRIMLRTIWGGLFGKNAY